MHILLIDDSSSTRSLLRTLINSGQTLQHEINEAASGEEALKKVEVGEIDLPDLIIVDINMGGMSGYELCREFRQRHSLGSDVMPYIIIVTANEGVEVINQALDSGANDYMAKPVNVKVLQVRLRVAERLLAQAQSGEGGGGAAAAASQAESSAESTGSAASADSTSVSSENPAVDPRQALIDWAIEQVDAPIAVVEVNGDEQHFRIIYANGATLATSQFSQEQLLGQSLSELEAWTPEFLKMTLGYTERGAILSHVPLWSRTQQSMPVHLSFYPIPSGQEQVKHYLVIHHF